MVADPYVIMQNLGKIATIIQTVSLFLGIGLVFGAFFEFKRYGEQRTFMSHQMTIAGPLLKLLAGACLLVLPTFLSTALQAFWTNASPLAYHATNQGWDRYVPVVIIFVRLIGVGAVIRSIIMFSRAGSSGHQPGTMGKAFILFISGLFLINIVGVYELFKIILDIA